MKWRSLEESGPVHRHAPAARNLRRAQRTHRQVCSCRRRRPFMREPSPNSKHAHSRRTSSPSARRLPRSNLPDHNGKLVSSSDLLAKGRLVLCFIRGRWCPFCVGQMEAMNLDPAADRACRSDARRHLAANREAVVLHARSAQAALSAALGCRQQSRAAVWPDVSRPPRRKRSTAARL